MKNYQKPFLCENQEARFESVLAAASGEVVTKLTKCPERGYEHPTLFWCLGCKYYYVERGKARCKIRNTFD